GTATPEHARPKRRAGARSRPDASWEGTMSRGTQTVVCLGAPGGQPWLLTHDSTPAVSRSQAELRFTRQHDFAISPIAMPLAVNVGLDHQPGAAAVAGLC